MFRKIVSNLAFSPGLLPQVGYYSRRITQENAVRRLGLVFAALTIIMQSLLFLSPATPSLAGSSNDLIYGGMRENGRDVSTEKAKDIVIDSVFSDKGESNGLKALFKYYDISKADVENSRDSYICSQRINKTVNGVDCSKSYLENIRSIGRQSKSTQDVQIKPADTSETFYHRPLSVFDKLNPINTYKVLEIVPGEMFILYSCGNIAFTQVPTSKLEITKNITSESDAVGVGGEVQFAVSLKNNSNVPAEDISITDLIDPSFKALSASNGGRISIGSDETQRVNWNIASLNPDEEFSANLRVRVNDRESQQVCNSASFSYTDTTGVTRSGKSNNVCVTVTLEVEPPVEMAAACQSLTTSATTERILIPSTVNFSPIVESYTTEVIGYEYFVNGTSQGRQDNPQFSYTFDKTDDNTINVIVYFSDGTKSSREDCSIQLRTTEEPNEKVDTAKSARVVSSFSPLQINDSDNRSRDAQGATVKANELIEYTVQISNIGNVDVDSYTLPHDDLRDVLEYADAISATGERSEDYTQPINLLGGGVLEDGIVTWESIESLSRGETISKSFYVQVKPRIPTTNTPPSDPLSYDCIMSNIYENEVDIDVDCSAEKEVVKAASSLPNTGPAEVAGITALLTFISMFLYFRNKQLVKELRVIKSEYNGGTL